VRARRLIVTAVLLVLKLPGTAHAGTYDVVACDAAPGGVNNSWSPYVSDSHMRTMDACASNGGLVASNRPGAGAPPYGAQAFQSFWAPDGNRVVSITYSGGFWRPGASEPGAEDYAAELVDGDGGRYLDGCSGATTTRCTPNYSGGRTLSLAPTSQISFVVSCFGWRCRDGLDSPAPEFLGASGALRITAATVRVSDSTSPAVSVTGGDLLGGWVGGARRVGWRATDKAGIRVVRATIDGNQRSAENLACDFTRPAPCPATADRSLEVATSDLADGPHALRLEAVDAAGNQAVAADTTIRVDNTAPAVRVTGAGNPAVAHAGPITVALDASDTASGMSPAAGAHIAWRLDGAAGWTRADGDEARVGVTGEGDHKLRWYAVDAAGNRSAEEARTVRIGGGRVGAPRSGGPGFSDATYNPDTTFSAAARFGPPCPASATLTAGRWAALRGDALVGFPLPAAPDCRVGSAVLRLYATAASAAGRRFDVARAGSAWDEATASWATRPGTVGAEATATPPSAPGWVEWDVTAQVQSIYAHGDNGLYVRDAAGGDTQSFCGRDCAASDHRPQLVIGFSG
jgi:hypothetical protein